jgi:hypothetical protein
MKNILQTLGDIAMLLIAIAVLATFTVAIVLDTTSPENSPSIENVNSLTQTQHHSALQK